MNILPKKSWHVRTKQNIERVRRDEAKAAEEQKEIERRIALAESEARTDLLRVKARKRKREDDDEEDSRVGPSVGHINFFQEEEDGLKKSGTNAEHEAEKRMEKEKQEKAIGLLTYLGQSSIESQNEKPWYFKPPEKRQKLEVSPDCDNLIKKKEEFDLKHKWGADPMKMMIQYLDTKEKVVDRDKGVPSRGVSHGYTVRTQQVVQPELGKSAVLHSANEASSLKKGKKLKRHEKHRKKRKKEYKKKKHKHKKKKFSQTLSSAAGNIPESSGSVTTADSTSCGRSIQELRAERIRRENEERKKREELLAKLRGDVPKQKEIPDDRERRYNSQFNPELVRKRKKKSSEVI
ncbi:hypothetical protein LSH36_101g00079 [Paralvinella palmiformis]|uniref:CBF1-interacting co-repressor CIR N-terminal domain-containing protein n=1 Tax=Paralvinella palmiformis TaxID=53620 RepID=A0AAD9JZ96_9ANNE|nr:hypothetical protein LSH36_101g00079 [Paralvinella palmiformis]